jgi:hypothetical protein
VHHVNVDDQTVPRTSPISSCFTLVRAGSERKLAGVFQKTALVLSRRREFQVPCVYQSATSVCLISIAFFAPGAQALARSLSANCVHRSGKAESGRSVIAWAAMIYAKGPGDIDPSPTTAGQSRLSGHGLDSSSAIGNSTTNPMPNLNAPMVKGSLWPAKYRVAPIAVPPMELDSIAAGMPKVSCMNSFRARGEGSERDEGAQGGW